MADPTDDTTNDTDGTEVPLTAAQRRDARHRELIELVATILLATATVLTAWTAFESTKWSGTQAIHFARAGALRTESAKAANRANSQIIVDVDVFVAWLSALSDERRIDPNASRAEDGTYAPAPDSLSGYLFDRFPDEFKPAVEAWIAMEPESNPDAAPTPFALPEFQLSAEKESDKLEARANHQTELARRDNQRGDNYVLTTVLFASVLFFAGVSSKLGSTRNRMATIILACIVLIVGVVIVATFPIQV